MYRGDGPPPGRDRGPAVKVGSLFSGIGGFDIGFERAGMEVAWQCEIDPHARAVLAKHWPGVPCYDDVRGISAGSVPDVDLICGGFPCQDVSMAGRRAGLAGERSGLWFEFHRVLAELKPPWVVIENVPGLLSSNGGRDMGTVLGGLGDLGYRWAYGVLDAQWFGVAQRRRRVFIVGHLGDGRAAEVLPLPAGLCGDPPPRRTAGQGVAADVAPSLTGSGRGTARAGESRGQDQIVLTRRGRDGGSADEIEQSGVTPALRTYGGGSSIPAVASPITERAGHHGYTQGAYPPNTEQPIAPIMSPQHQLVTYAIQDVRGMDKGQNGLGVQASDVSYTLDALATQGVYVPDVVPNAMSSKWAKGTADPSGDEVQNLVSLGRPRRLTPTECERLQGFPDGWTAGQADSHRYRKLGNAVPVPVAEWIGRRIMAVQP